MKPIWRIALMVLTVGGAGAGLCHALPPLTQQLGLAFDGTAESLSRLAREQKRLELLEQKLQVVQRRLDGKKVIVADLMAHRLTLPEAVSRFRDLCGDALARPRPPAGVPVDPALGPAPGQSDEEWLFRRVLDYVRVEESLSPRPDPVFPRLQAEFEERLQTAFMTSDQGTDTRSVR